MKKLLSLVLISFVVLSANAAVLRVAASGDNSDGSSWAKAFQTIQGALAVATVGDEVWVSQGTYVISTEATQLSMVSGVNVYGGFAGTETTLNARSTNAALTVVTYDEAATETFRLLVSVDLDDATLWDGFTFDGKNGARGVTLSGNCTLNNSVVKNCTVENGSGAAVYMRAGSGFVPVTLSSCDLLNNTIEVTTANTSSIGGAGVFVKEGSKMALISNCNIANNTIDGIEGSGTLIAMGAGILITEGVIRDCYINNNNVVNSANATYSSNNFTAGAIAIIPEKVDVEANEVLIEGCTITNCTSISRGGAILIDPRWSGQYHGNYTISKTIIRNNKSNVVGGGILATAPTKQTGTGWTLNINNSVIANNTGKTGGGMYMNIGMVLNITNSTIVNNQSTVTYGGGGIFMQGAANHTITATLKNTLLWGNVYNGTSSAIAQIRNNQQASTVIFSAIQDYDEVAADWGTALLGDNILLETANDAAFDAPAFFAPASAAGYGVADALTADWHITENSACIDYGDDYLADDLDGNLRPKGDFSDIGAYEFDSFNPPTSLDEVPEKTKQFSVYSDVNGIVVNTEVDGSLQVYSITGQLLKAVNAHRGENRIHLQNKQMVIVLFEGVAQKVIVK
ncbi:MAG: hypothetical protein JEZ14_07810 [Marinilabiliaceae bacterium]|nr:hypothetical protein [Marinilabiliaceae bacterium]